MSSPSDAQGPTDEDVFAALERKPYMGMNYAIVNGKVYGVMTWALGGTAYRETYKPGDRDYKLRYLRAANDTSTIFWGGK